MRVFLLLTILTYCSISLAAPERSGERVQKKDCKEGEVWKEDCHSCHCSMGIPACTRELCESEATYKVELPPDAENKPKSKREAECVKEEIWKENCQVCECINGHKECTKDLDPCTRENESVEELEDPENEDEKCPPNVTVWEEDCNKCYCGEDGLKVCSRALCPDQGPSVAIKPKE